MISVNFHGGLTAYSLQIIHGIETTRDATHTMRMSFGAAVFVTLASVVNTAAASLSYEMRSTEPTFAKRKDAGKKLKLGI